MNVLLRDRGHGKTWDLITKSSKENIPIVCVNQNHKKHIQSIAMYRCLLIPEPIVLNELKYMMLGRHDNKVLVDDAEWVLQKLLPQVSIQGISITVNKSAYF